MSPKNFLLLLPLFFCWSCTLFFSAQAPMKIISYPEQVNSQSNTLFVFLPGRHSQAIDFETEGFRKLVKDAKISADCVFVEAHLGYYVHRNLTLRLYEDVIAPALKKGYKKIWLIGISLGGLGTLLYTKEQTQGLAGIFVLAPFLGDDGVIEEIQTAGGLMKWEPNPVPTPSQDYQRNLWYWLKNFTQKSDKVIPLYLGVGSEDRFKSANEILADVLQETRVIRVKGPHDWQPWRDMFAEFLIRLKTQHAY